MRKIPSLFERDWNGDRSKVTQAVNPVCQWVIDGEGIATRKFDGTACLVENGVLYVRFDAKNGKQPPSDFRPAQEVADPETGHWPGWVPAADKPVYKWQRVAYEFTRDSAMLDGDGTYEAVGPHFQSNPEGYARDVLVKHGCEVVEAPRTFVGLAEWFKTQNIEGIVWHHPDGRMTKIKASDFGVRRGGSTNG